MSDLPPPIIPSGQECLYTINKLTDNAGGNEMKEGDLDLKGIKTITDFAFCLYL